MFLKILISCVIAAVLIFLMWYARGVMVTPVCRGKNLDLTVLLKVSGPAPGLENTVDGLLWLIGNGTLTGDIHIVDNGMDAETKKRSELLAKKHDGVVSVGDGAKGCADGENA